MIDDIHDINYNSPLANWEKKPRRKAKDEYEEYSPVIWWMSVFISAFLLFIYILSLYFTYYDDPGEYSRSFDNKKILRAARILAGHQLTKSLSDKTQEKTISESYQGAH